MNTAWQTSEKFNYRYKNNWTKIRKTIKNKNERNSCWNFRCFNAFCRMELIKAKSAQKEKTHSEWGDHQNKTFSLETKLKLLKKNKKAA